MVIKTDTQITLVKTDTCEMIADSLSWHHQETTKTDSSHQPKHSLVYTAYDNQQAVGYLSFATDFALFGQITLIKTHPAYDRQVLESILLEALYEEAQRYNLWRIKGFGNYSEWTNPRFNRDLGMVL